MVRQIPAPGGKIASYDPVSLQVSAGPFESGYIIRQVHVLASVPVSDDATGAQSQADVKLTVTDATGKYDLYHAYAEPGQKLDFNVTAIGTSLVDLYVNDRLVGETRLGTEPPVVYGSKPAQPLKRSSAASSPSPLATP